MFDTHVPVHRVLIVDDQSVPRSLESFALEGTGRYFTMQASNASDALTMLASEEYDAAIIDVDMPDMSGVELVTKIRERIGHSRLPIVLILPREQDSGVDDNYDCGATETIQKPFDPWELARVLDTLTGPIDGLDQVLSVEAVLQGFPYLTMILDGEHHVLLANGPFYEATGTGIGECYVHCMHEMHEGGEVPDVCPLEEAKLGGRAASREVETNFGRLRTSVYPLAIKTSEGNALYLHVTEPITCECD